MLPFRSVRISGSRDFASGQGPTHADGSLALPLGKVGREVSPEQGYVAARLTGLAVLGSLLRTLGDLILEVFRPTIGAHGRGAVGMAKLPFDFPAEIEGKVALRSLRPTSRRCRGAGMPLSPR